MPSLVWLVTGATSGIGNALVNEIVSRGDRVIASGRNVETRLGHLKSDNLALQELDIAANSDEIQVKISAAWSIFGHIDIVVNNAGMSALKSAEEADSSYIDRMFQVNLFGHMRVTQAIIPLLRAQGHGRVAFTSSSTAWTPLPFMSHYAASKAALSAYVDGLHVELSPHGIKCVSFECGGFPTHLGQPREGEQGGFGAMGPAIDAYGQLFGELMGVFAANPMGHMPGDVSKAAKAMVDVLKVEGLAKDKSWAVRVAIGSDGRGSAEQKCREMLQLLDEWKELSSSSDRDGQEIVANKELFKFTTILKQQD